jgi:hypothetical protein
MRRFLHGVHDCDGAELMADKPGWLVLTEAIGCDPKDTSGVNFYAWTSRGFGVIVRLNNGYYSDNSYPGTIPTPDRYDEFSVRCANFVAASNGCDIVIIGNETNMTDETPDRKGIHPADYARCYQMCRQAIHRVNPNVQVLVAGCAPWNNQSGDWLDYWRSVLRNVGEECDGVSIHCYSHGSDPSLITSEEMVHGWHWHFRVYQDQLKAMPAILYGLPVYISETDQDNAWADTNSGWVQEAYAEIDRWNETNLPAIHALCLFRSQLHDKWSFAHKNGVKADFRAAVERGYTVPIVDPPPTPTPPQPTPEPPTPLPEPEPPMPTPIDWDPRLTVRGCTLQHALMPSDIAPLVKIGRWFNKEEAQGRVNIYVRLLDEDGLLAVGVPVTQFWSSGSETKLTEVKRDPWLASKGLGDGYSLDFAMYEVAPSYGIKIEGDYRGDIVSGCGLGSIEQPDYKIHTAYFFEWQLSSEGLTPPSPLPPLTPAAGRLVWPAAGPITQNFGEGDAQFGQRGHNGIDIACAEGTPVACIADGVVMYTGNDAPGYGNYVRVYHAAIHSHSFYAHLSAIHVEAGQPVKQGDTLGASGSTGNSTGPHVHFELRAGSKDAYYQGVTFGYTQGRYNPTTAYVVTGSPLTPGAGPGR